MCYAWGAWELRSVWPTCKEKGCYLYSLKLITKLGLHVRLNLFIIEYGKGVWIRLQLFACPTQPLPIWPTAWTTTFPNNKKRLYISTNLARAEQEFLLWRRRGMGRKWKLVALKRCTTPPSGRRTNQHAPSLGSEQMHFHLQSHDIRQQGLSTKHVLRPLSLIISVTKQWVLFKALYSSCTMGSFLPDMSSWDNKPLIFFSV